MSNMRIWDALSKTDPRHTNQFKRAGGFSGTAIRPIWMIKRLTEQFGPAGQGWGMDAPAFQVVNAGNAGDEILVYCTVGLWYKEGESQGTVYGVGGDKVLIKRRDGTSFANDEAFKSSYTDALSNAMKQIGVGADIHMGMFEDEKYVRQTEREFEKKEYAADPDVTDAASRWVMDESGVLATISNEEDVKGWSVRNSKALKKLSDQYPAQYDKVMDVYGKALERARERV